MKEIDAPTLARARRGDRAARHLLIETYQRPVYALTARMMVSQPSLADDLAQDSFLKALEALPRFDPRGPARLSTWILTIATRACIDALRRSRRLVLVPGIAASEGGGDQHRDREPAALERTTSASLDLGSVERALESRELKAHVERAMALLSDDQRAILILRAYHDLDYPEIAAALGIEEGTVKSRLSRARAALAKALSGSAARRNGTTERTRGVRDA